MQMAESNPIQIRKFQSSGTGIQMTGFQLHRGQAQHMTARAYGHCTPKTCERSSLRGFTTGPLAAPVHAFRSPAMSISIPVMHESEHSQDTWTWAIKRSDVPRTVIATTSHFSSTELWQTPPHVGRRRIPRRIPVYCIGIPRLGHPHAFHRRPSLRAYGP